MRLERVTLYHISMPLVRPFETSFGVEQDRQALIVRVESDGATGWGECVAGAGPWYSYETIGTARHVLTEFLLPLLGNRDIQDPAAVHDMMAPVRGHNMAKAGLEMALWDLTARRQGVPLATLLGGTRSRVPVGVSVGIQPSIPALVEQVGEYLEAGYGRIKIKIKPGWDVEVARTLRAEFPEAPLQVDANSAYTLADAPIFEAMDDLGLLLVEQPLAHDDIYAHSRLQQRLETALCLDESIHSVDDARAALELGSCRIINIKPGRVGGYTSSIRIHDYCRESGAPVWHGGMLETGIGRAHSVALASLPNFTLPGDISASARYYLEEIIDTPFVLNEDSTLSVPEGPGTGVTVDEAQLDRFTLSRTEYRPA